MDGRSDGRTDGNILVGIFYVKKTGNKAKRIQQVSFNLNGIYLIFSLPDPLICKCGLFRFDFFLEIQSSQQVSHRGYGRTDRRRLESHPISSPGAFGSGELNTVDGDVKHQLTRS